MKRFVLLLTLFLLLPAKAFNTPDGWETDLTAAQIKAAKQKKPLLIVIAGPDWNKSSKSLCKNVIDDYLFNMISRKYAVCLFLNQARDIDFKSNRVPKDINALKTVLPGTTVPRYAIFNANLKLLSKPSKRSISGFMRAISTASEQLSRTPISAEDFRQASEYESKKNARQQPRKKEKEEKSSCRSSSKSCSSSSRSGCRLIKYYQSSSGSCGKTTTSKCSPARL